MGTWTTILIVMAFEVTEQYTTWPIISIPPGLPDKAPDR